MVCLFKMNVALKLNGLFNENERGFEIWYQMTCRINNCVRRQGAIMKNVLPLQSVKHQTTYKNTYQAPLNKTSVNIPKDMLHLAQREVYMGCSRNVYMSLIHHYTAPPMGYAQDLAIHFAVVVSSVTYLRVAFIIFLRVTSPAQEQP